MKISVSLVIAVLFFSCAHPRKESLPFYNTPDFTPQWLNDGDKEDASLHTIAPFSFTDQDGKTISNKEVKGNIYVANFFFTTCTSICPKMMHNLQKVQQAFQNKNDVWILSHSVMPEKDSVGRLRDYAARFSVNSSQWHLLTGNKEAIYTMARQSYFADEESGYNKTSNEFLHTENCVLVDRGGRIRGVYNATLELEMSKLIEHIKILLQE